MEDNNEKMVQDEEMTTEIVDTPSETDEKVVENQSEDVNTQENEQSACENIQKEEKVKLTFDEKVDATAGFVKKYKIAILCGIIAVVALVIGLFIGSAIGGGDENAEESSSYQASVSDEVGSGETVISTTSPTVTTEETAEEVEAVVITYADLLDNVVYFAESSDISLAEADVIELLNNVLTASGETVTANGLDADSKAEISDTVNVSVTKDEMKALLDDLGATFTSIDQSVSGDILTLDVDMSINIPEEVLTEVKANSDWLVSTALMFVGTNFSFSYQVSYQMDGESLIPIEVTESTIDIGGLGEDMTETIADVALSSYSSADVDTETLLAGYNSMAGEIIADILNNYGIVTGATSSAINITTRTSN